jgi:hypothetical protein
MCLANFQNMFQIFPTQMNREEIKREEKEGSSKTKCLQKETTDQPSKSTIRFNRFNKHSKFLWDMRTAISQRNVEADEEENASFLESLDALLLEDLRNAEEPAIHLGHEIALLVNYCLDRSSDKNACIIQSPFRRRAAMNLAGRIAKYKWRRSSWVRIVKMVGNEATLWLTMLIASSGCLLQETKKSNGLQFNWARLKYYLGKDVQDSLEKFCRPHRCANYQAQWEEITTVPFEGDMESLDSLFAESLVRFQQAYFFWRGQQEVVCSDLNIPPGEDGDDQKWVCYLFCDYCSNLSTVTITPLDHFIIFNFNPRNCIFGLV